MLRCFKYQGNSSRVSTMERHKDETPDRNNYNSISLFNDAGCNDGFLVLHFSLL